MSATWGSFSRVMEHSCGGLSCWLVYNYAKKPGIAVSLIISEFGLRWPEADTHQCWFFWACGWRSTRALASSFPGFYSVEESTSNPLFPKEIQSFFSGSFGPRGLSGFQGIQCSCPAGMAEWQHHSCNHPKLWGQPNFGAMAERWGWGRSQSVANAWYTSFPFFGASSFVSSRKFCGNIPCEVYTCKRMDVFVCIYVQGMLFVLGMAYANAVDDSYPMRKLKRSMMLEWNSATRTWSLQGWQSGKARKMSGYMPARIPERMSGFMPARIQLSCF